MSYIEDWNERLEIFEMYLDLDKGDGCLIMVLPREPEECIGTIYCSAGDLKGVVWRGSATRRPQQWRARQQIQASEVLARIHSQPR